MWIIIAEQHLLEAQKNPAHPLQVLRLVASPETVDLSVCQSAAVHFKNIVKKGWAVNEVSYSRNAYDSLFAVVLP